MEQRAEARYSIRLLVRWTNGTKRGTGVTVNLGQGGCAIQSDTEVAPESSIALQLFPLGYQTPLEIDQAVVCWAHDNTFGVEFLAMRSAEQERLERFLKTKGGSAT